MVECEGIINKINKIFMSNRNLIAIIIILAVAVFIFWKFSGGDSLEKGLQNMQKEQTQADQTNQEQKKEQVVQEESKVSCKRDFNPEVLSTAKVELKGKYVELDIKNFGKVKLKLFDKDAPKTVENFLRLVNAGFYDCLTFHRVAKNFVIQGGDPTGTGGGGQSAFGGDFEDELNPKTESYKAGYEKGILAMANRGPNTNSSQFFIMLKDASLPKNYTIFGKVESGIEVVEKIGEVDITPGLGPTDGSPIVPVVINSAKILDK